MEQVVIGVDPHKLFATIEVVGQQEQLLGSLVASLPIERKRPERPSAPAGTDWNSTKA